MVLEVVIGDALVHLLCTPFRRIMMIQAVHLDLEEEHFSYLYSLRHRRTRQKGEKDKKKKKALKARSPLDFRHMGEAACFLYEVGGLRFFFCGGLLDVASVFLKYYVQVWLIIPVFRRLPPLPMHSFVLFSTLIHTAVMFVPVASIQCLVSALILNKITDFTRASAPRATSLFDLKTEIQSRLLSFFHCSFFTHILATMRIIRCKETRENDTECCIGSDSCVTATFNKARVMSELDENGKTQRVEGQSDDEKSVKEDSSVRLHQNTREECIGHAVVVKSSDFFETFSGAKSRRRFSCATAPPVLSVVPLQATKRVRVSAMTPNSHNLVPPFLSSRAGVTTMEEQRGVRSTSSSRRSSLQEAAGECGQWSFRSNLMQDHLGKNVDPNRRYSLEFGDASSPFFHTSGGEASLPHLGAHSCGVRKNDGNSEKNDETFTPRFSGWTELMEALYYEFPVWRFLKKVTFIEFLSRYFSSVVSNMLVSRLYSYLAAKNSSSSADGGGIENLRSCVFSSLLCRGAPLAVSVGVSLITYPLVTLPFLHFLRLAHYEYLRRESAAKRLDAELNGYFSPSELQSLTITPVVFSAPSSPAFNTFLHKPEVNRGIEATDIGIGDSNVLQNETTVPFFSNLADEKDREDTLGDASANTSFTGSRGSLDPAGGDVWLQVEMNDDELLDERNLYSTHPRNVKTSISVGNWWVESIFLKLYHADVRSYLSFIINRHGILALYNGWGGHVSQLICQCVAGVIIQETIAKLFPM